MDQENNQKEPRNRRKVKYSLRAPYAFYKESLKKKERREARRYKRISYGDFRKINARFNELLAEQLVQGKAVEFPAGMGQMFVISLPLESDPKYYQVDWGHWQKTGQIKKHLNEHTNFTKSRFYWRKKAVKGVRIYKFIADADLRHGLAKECFKGKIYNEVQTYIEQKKKRRRRNDLQTNIE